MFSGRFPFAVLAVLWRRAENGIAVGEYMICGWGIGSGSLLCAGLSIVVGVV
jgi:hypothetical protein